MSVMNEPLYLKPENQRTNEPVFHPLIRNSLFYVKSTGMRLAPEVLLLELMRELIVGPIFNENKKEQHLSPKLVDDKGNKVFNDNEKAVLYAMKGRRKQNKNSRQENFYAPVYPYFASYGWTRRNSERVAFNFFLQGPLSQFFWSRGPDSQEGKIKQNEVAHELINALVGKKSKIDPDDAESYLDKDILAATMSTNLNCLSTSDYIDLFMQKTNYNDSVIKANYNDVTCDELANRISNDLIHICKLEGDIPRMQWIDLFMTYLRFVVPIWLLAQMKLSRILYGWLLDSMQNGYIPTMSEIADKLARRNRELLTPTITPTRTLHEHIESYIKERVELNILLFTLQQARPTELNEKTLSLFDEGKDYISVSKLLAIAKNTAKEITTTPYYQKIAGSQGLKTFLVREAERFAAWQNPLMKGQGKNIDEFFRIMYKADKGDEKGGYLLIPHNRRNQKGFMVFPGQLLLKTITFLAHKDRNTNGKGGMLILNDIEALFSQYGIDFSKSADARPILINELRSLGLLTGSPDAGSSVSVISPY